VVGLGEIRLDGEAVYWAEMRPGEGGRSVIVRRALDGTVSDQTPPPFNARTRVHEYGGGAFTVQDGVIYFSNFSDQRLYRQDPGEAPRPITPEGEWRYADGLIDSQRGRMICVREDHPPSSLRSGVPVSGHEPVNTLVSVDLTGQREPQVLVSGSDFYSNPRLSPDGRRLAWLAWNHPNMPWDGTELWIGEIQPDGSVGAKERIAGGPDESIFQPEWSPDGVLYFVSDRTGWWNLYRQGEDGVEALVSLEAEFGLAQWVFGMSTYAFASSDRLICCYTQNGIWRLGEIDLRTRVPAQRVMLAPIDLPYTSFSGIRTAAGQVGFLAGSPSEPSSIVQLDLATKQYEVLRRSSPIDEELRPYFTSPEPVEFPTENGLTAHALFYPPHNPDYQAPGGERPPLLVKCHGGPTAAAGSTPPSRSSTGPAAGSACWT
jgi:dipeptidyl aminopeptidase/acylaminoacyl peptidase